AVLSGPDAPSGVASRAGAGPGAARRRRALRHAARQAGRDRHEARRGGRTLARMHRAGAYFAHPQPNLRSLPWWQETVPSLLPFVSDAQRDLLSAELAHQQAFFASSDYAALPAGPCHCDLFRDNVLFAHAE